jgi:hypothetical protein
VQIVGKHLDGFAICRFFQLAHQLQFQRQENLGTPAQTDTIQQPFIGSAAFVLHAEALGDQQLVSGTFGNRRFIRLIFQCQAEHAFIASAQQSQRAMGWRGANGFAMVEVVGKLGTFLLLACHHAGSQLAFVPQLFAQAAQQLGIFGKLLDQDGTRTVQCSLDIGHACFGIEIVCASVSGCCVGSASRLSASGCKPASRAICALVRRLGL